MSNKALKVFLSFVPPVNFLVIVLLVVGFTHLFNASNAYSKCLNVGSCPDGSTVAECKGEKGPCVMFRAGGKVCTNWQCLTFSISCIIAACYLIVLQLPFVANPIITLLANKTTDAGKSWTMFGFMSPLIVAAILVAVTVFVTDKKTTNSVGGASQDPPQENALEWVYIFQVICFIVAVIMFAVAVIVTCRQKNKSCILFE